MLRATTDASTSHVTDVCHDDIDDLGGDDGLGTCPFDVERAVMLHRWESLTFLHWSFAPDAVQRLLPEHLTVETFDDRAWVGLVPFYMRVRTEHVNAVPWVSQFCETNVRTYVR